MIYVFNPYQTVIVVSVRSVGWLQVYLGQRSLRCVSEGAIVLRPCLGVLMVAESWLCLV